MDGFPGSQAIAVFLPRLLRLILQEGCYSWPRRHRLFADNESLRLRWIVRGHGAQSNRSGQQSHDTWPHHHCSLRPSSILNRSPAFPAAPKHKVLHCVLTISDPMPYQPSSCRPSMAKRTAGWPVLGSSIATRKPYVPSARFSGMYTVPSNTTSPGSHLRTSTGTRRIEALLVDLNSTARVNSLQTGATPAFSHTMWIGTIEPA